MYVWLGNISILSSPCVSIILYVQFITEYCHIMHTTILQYRVLIIFVPTTTIETQYQRHREGSLNGLDKPIKASIFKTQLASHVGSLNAKPYQIHYNRMQ